MSRIVLGNCLTVLPTLPDRAVDFVLTDPPYLVDYQDREGRRIANDTDDSWLLPAFREIHRILRDDAFCISFYGWSRVDRFFSAWRAAGFRVAGHIVFAKPYLVPRPTGRNPTGPSPQNSLHPLKASRTNGL
ncbi:DNA methyltransferase [Verminephrobacter eiseniae]|uniref:DNA modification methylase-like protein n=1 Tax=Verminephrobacter eiseniae (strain EF01-2) TaxID=391735 RepID=A1WP78_VEREI|nr:DNA methyltransferase [Verminephrobacter eiseniae]ABM59435.1 DNA modification methylase-like protein [Verminephrobacter eiseniae EF01-2]